MFKFDSLIQYGQALTSIKSLSISATENIQTLALAVSNLTPKQQALALATKGLTQTQIVQVMETNKVEDAEIQQALSTTALIAKKEQLTGAYAEDILISQGLNAEKAKEILTSAGIVAGDESEVISKKQVSTATLIAKLNQEGLSAAQIKAITTQLGLGTSTLTLSNYFKGLAVSIGAALKELTVFLFTNPVGWAILAGATIAGTVAIVDHFTVSLEESREALKELKQECSNIDSDLKSVSDELQTTIDRMNELEGKDTLTFTEKEEYDNLVKTNNELQRKIDLLKLEQEQKNNEKNKTFVQTMDKDFYDGEYHFDQYTGRVQSGIGGKDVGMSTSESSYIKQQFADRQELVDKLSKEENQKERDRIQKQIDEIDDYLQKKNSEWETDADGISYISNPSTKDEESVNYWLDYINDFQDKMAIAMGGENAKTNAFNRIVDNWKFDTLTQELQDLGEQGKVTAEMLSDDKYAEFIQKLVDLGVVDSADSLNEIAYAFNTIGNEAQDSTPKIENATSAIDVSEAEQNLSEYSETVKKIISEKEKLDNAFSEQKENGFISTSTAVDLIGNGYASAVKYDKETDSYYLLADAINTVIKAKNSETIASLESEKASLLATKARYKELQASAKKGSSTYEYWEEQIAECDDTINNYESYISVLEGYDCDTSEFKNTISEISSKIEEYSENISKIASAKSTLKEAIEQQEEFGMISGENISSLVEAGYGSCLVYDEATGATRLLVDATNDLTEAQIENQKVQLDKTISNITDEIKKQEAILSSMTYNSAWDVEYTKNTRKKIQEKINELQEQLDDATKNKMVLMSYKFSFESDSESIEESAEETVDDYIEAVKTEFENKKSELDHLLAMDVITEDNYYSRLNELNEEYFANKEDLLDEYRKYEEEIYKNLKQQQIDSIQEQIDALKSVNEEKQEEIDLEKAKIALENARKQKTISVYDSERGWIHETDRDAIDSAQKEYDNLVLDKKVSELEDLIDSIENGTNTTHDLNETIGVQEQVNSITAKSISGNEAIYDMFPNLSREFIDSALQDSSNLIQSASDVLNNQIQGKDISNSDYITNNNSLVLNDVTVVANNPEEFIDQMEEIADKSFEKNFPSAMNEFGEGLKRYKLNHTE